MRRSNHRGAHSAPDRSTPRSRPCSSKSSSFSAAAIATFPPPRSRKFFRPALEALLDRILPANMTCVWSGDGPNNNASNVLNWVGGVEPQDNTDSVELRGASGQLPNGDKPIVFDVGFIGAIKDLSILPGYTGGAFGVEVARPLTIAGTVYQDASTLTLDLGMTLTAQSYQVNGGFIQGTGTLAITGTPNGPGSIDFNEPTTQTFGQLTIDEESQLLLGTDTTFDSTQITNNGSTRWTDGAIQMVGNATFTNAGTFTVLCDQTWQSLGGGPFVNVGDFSKEQTFGATRLQVQFNNQGPQGHVEIESGRTVQGFQRG